jgi:rhomboid protease GluP
LALGVPLIPRMTAGRERYLSRQKVTFAVACFFLALVGYWIANLL